MMYTIYNIFSININTKDGEVFDGTERYDSKDTRGLQ